MHASANYTQNACLCTLHALLSTGETLSKFALPCIFSSAHHLVSADRWGSADEHAHVHAAPFQTVAIGMQHACFATPLYHALIFGAFTRTGRGTILATAVTAFGHIVNSQLTAPVAKAAYTYVTHWRTLVVV